MKKYICYFVILLIIALSVLLEITINNNNKYLEDIKTYDNNFKALTLEADSLKNQAIAYQFNIEQLEYINDSIVDKLNNTRRELEIKDKDLKQLQYILSEGNIKDTIVFKDTVFRDNFVKIDTTLGDKWYTLTLQSVFPTSLYYDISYVSELEAVAYKERVTIGTPKNCFIGRWFQKKQDIIKVNIFDNNPYATIKQKKFIIIDDK